MRDTYMDQFESRWTDDARRKFRREPVIIRHNYHEHHGFSDIALAALIERHPRGLIDFCTMGDDAPDHGGWRAGDPDALSGMELIEAVRMGKLWINLRHGMDMDPEYRPIFEKMLADMKRADRRFRPLQAGAGILISSPSAQGFLHSDVSETMLWHMRGVKRFRTYPARLPYLDTVDVEAVLHKDATERNEFDPAWDAAAFTVDLHPGMAASWPLHGPYRIENQSGVNVSVAFEISTRQSWRRNAVLYANGVLRRRLGWKPRSTSTEGMGALFKLALTAAEMLRTKLFGETERPVLKRERPFGLDPQAPDGLDDRMVA